VARRLRLPGEQSVVDLGGQHADVVSVFVRTAARGAVIDPGSDHYVGDGSSVQAYHSIEEARATGATFDAAISLQTFEHVRAPREMLEALLTIVRPGGKVLVEVPYDLLEFQIGDRRVVPLADPHPEHLNFFTPSSLARLAETTGLMVETVAITLAMQRFGGMTPSIVAIARSSPSGKAGTAVSSAFPPPPLALEVSRDRRKVAALRRLHRLVNAGLRVGW
jgi:SAM-dependent methyltransferase